MIMQPFSLCSLYYFLSSYVDYLYWLLHAFIELLQHGLDIILVINFHKAESPVLGIVILVVTSLVDVSPIYPYHYATFFLFADSSIISKCLFKISMCSSIAYLSKGLNSLSNTSLPSSVYLLST